MCVYQRNNEALKPGFSTVALFARKVSVLMQQAAVIMSFKIYVYLCM